MYFRPILDFLFFFSAPSCFMVPSADQKLEAIHCHVKFQHPEGDHFTLINVYKAFKQCQGVPREFPEHHRQSACLPPTLTSAPPPLVRLRRGRVVPGPPPGPRCPADGWRPPRSAHRNPEKDWDARFSARLRFSQQQPQHQESPAGRFLYAGQTTQLCITKAQHRRASNPWRFPYNGGMSFMKTQCCFSL